MEKWIVPCNIKRFNIVEHFKKSGFVIWKNSFTIRTGDTVYIYIGSPLSQIKYRCTVISDQVDEETLQKNEYAIVKSKGNNYFSKKVKYIQLRCDYGYPDGCLPLSVLKENGLGQVQIQARTDRNLQRYLDEIDKRLGFVDNLVKGRDAHA